MCLISGCLFFFSFLRHSFKSLISTDVGSETDLVLCRFDLKKTIYPEFIHLFSSKLLPSGYKSVISKWIAFRRRKQVISDASPPGLRGTRWHRTATSTPRPSPLPAGRGSQFKQRLLSWTIYKGPPQTGQQGLLVLLYSTVTVASAKHPVNAYMLTVYGGR